MENIISILDWILFILFAINILYVLVYSIGSHRAFKRLPQPESHDYRSFVILIAAYKEDKVIYDTVTSCLKQDYPRDKYEILVISDHMEAATNARLRALPIKVLQVDFEQSTNTKSLKAGLMHLGERFCDVAVVIDADNLIAPTFLADVNAAFAVPGVRALQTHRVAKNLNTNMAYLDAVSEETNNAIFRLGHINLGMSAALIGSGMAFEYALFHEIMMSNNSLGGFDRVLELKLFYRGISIHYLPDTYVWDEKVQHSINFYHQRRRWMAAQFYSLGEFVCDLLPAIRMRRWDFCDKMFQQFSIPRLLLLGFTFIFAVFLTVTDPDMAWKWWGAFVAITLALGLAVPRRLWGWKLLKAICQLPVSFFYMFLNLFRLRSANRRFLHTPHGVE